MRRGQPSTVEMVLTGLVSRQAVGRLTVETPGLGFTDITAEAARFVTESGIRHGLLTVFCRHTSASLTIQENADPDVQTDLLTALDRLAPRNAGYVHGCERVYNLKTYY
jgi:secondary thiamine-phosphate synthase enzyme